MRKEAKSWPATRERSGSSAFLAFLGIAHSAFVFAPHANPARIPRFLSRRVRTPELHPRDLARGRPTLQVRGIRRPDSRTDRTLQEEVRRRTRRPTLRLRRQR